MREIDVVNALVFVWCCGLTWDGFCWGCWWVPMASRAPNWRRMADF